jgi:hypothetical protein
MQCAYNAQGMWNRQSGPSFHVSSTQIGDKHKKNTSMLFFSPICGIPNLESLQIRDLHSGKPLIGDFRPDRRFLVSCVAKNDTY